MRSVDAAPAPAGEVEAFLQRCEPSADAAYAELRALLLRLHDPATRRHARLFLAALRRRQQLSDGFFRRYGFRVQELALHNGRCGLPITASAFLSGASAAEPESIKIRVNSLPQLARPQERDSMH